MNTYWLTKSSFSQLSFPFFVSHSNRHGARSYALLFSRESAIAITGRSGDIIVTGTDSEELENVHQWVHIS